MIKNEIQILSDREHIIKRSGMYIGSVANEEHERFVFGEYKKITYVPGLVKIIDEIIDNSVDEGIRTRFAHANKIEVTIKDNKVTVTDNGRGIPQTDVQTPEGEVIPGPVAAWTRAKAGGNFGDDADRETGGMNGVGSSLTNFFSMMFKGTTSDGKNEIVVSCTNGAENISWKSKPAKTNGTSVEFVPDFTHFECNQISDEVITVIQDRLNTLAVIYPNVEFKFNGKKVQGNFRKYAKQFGEDVVIHDEDNCSMAFATSPDGFRHLSYVNNIHTKNGGTHIEFIMDSICENLIPAIKRKHKIEINKTQIKSSLTMLMFVRNMKNLRFDSQTKERLTSPYGEIKGHLGIESKDIDKLAKQILNNESVIMPIIESALARKLAAEAAAATKASKKALKAKVSKHIKANKYGDDKHDTTLFLTEGESAIGYLISVRDQDLHGGYALRGKVLNTWGMKPVDVIKNKELFDIMAITGLQFGEDGSGMYYQNIAIMTDADVDGTGSIYPSLLAFFARWPELFAQGRIRFVKTPVIIAAKGKDAKWYYDLPEYEAAKPELKGYDIRYIKGLGSLEEDEYERVIKDPVYDVVELPDNYIELFDMLMGDDASKRKEWMMG